MPSQYECIQVTDYCTVQDSIYGYYPTLPGSAFFLALFAICLVAQIIEGVRWKTWTFMIGLSIGCFVEMLGYVGRIKLHFNPYDNTGFMIQICCLIMGPAWLTAGIYLTLKHLVKAFGREYSYLRPKYYTWIFIGCDVFSLTLQAAGGGLASGASGNSSQLTLGNNFAISGIIFQVVTLIVFAGLASLYFVRRHLHPDASKAVEPQLQTTKFRLFCAAIVVAFFAILTRCIYRIAEMSGGWGNPLMQNQREFIALDSSMCAIAVVALTVFHPGYCFPQMAVPIGVRRPTAPTELEQKPSHASSHVDVEAGVKA